MKAHVSHPEASREYAEAAEYYARIQPELGGRFYDELEGLIADSRRQPGYWRNRLQNEVMPSGITKSQWSVKTHTTVPL